MKQQTPTPDWGDTGPQWQVTIINTAIGARETQQVQATDEWKARTMAMVRTTLPLRGERVEYLITAL